MLDKLNILKPIIPEKSKEKIKHLALSLADTNFFAKSNKSPEELFKKRNELIKEITSLQIEQNITILTIYLMGRKELQNLDYLEEHMNSIAKLFEELANHAIITNNKVKVFVLGKWYDLSGVVVDSIKKCSEMTKDYDSYFLNFCINYDGQDEILDATKILARKVKLGKVDVENISLNDIKENLYSSYFIPPEKIIVASRRKKLLSFMLWDSAFSKIIFMERNWDELSKRDFEKFYTG